MAGHRGAPAVPSLPSLEAGKSDESRRLKCSPSATRRDGSHSPQPPPRLHISTTCSLGRSLSLRHLSFPILTLCPLHSRTPGRATRCTWSLRKKKATPWAVYCPPHRHAPQERRTGGRGGAQKSPGAGSGGAAWPSLLYPPLSATSYGHAFMVPEASVPAESGPRSGWARVPALAGFPPAAMASDHPASLPTVHGIKWTCSNGNSSSGFSVEQLVQQILDSHQTKPQPRTHNCLCTGSLGERGRPQRARGQRGRCQAAGVMTTRGDGSARSQTTAQHPGQLSLVLPGGAGAAGGQPTLDRREQFPERRAL